MGMIEDVMRALERIPVWKRVSALPTEIESLKQRVAAIEQQLAGGAADACPMCGAREFVRVATKSDPMFGAVGFMLDTFQCRKCQHSEDRQRDAMQVPPTS